MHDGVLHEALARQRRIVARRAQRARARPISNAISCAVRDAFASAGRSRDFAGDRTSASCIAAASIAINNVDKQRIAQVRRSP